MSALAYPHRADAQRNHALLLAAAAEAFAQDGIDVSAEEIARRAGVAKGTLFRHFATKEQLLTAVLVDRVGQLRAIVAALAQQPDPGRATLAELIRAGAELATVDRSFFAAATCATIVDVEVAAAKEGLARDIDALLARAQRSGEVREDLTGADITMLIIAAANICAPFDDRCAELRGRYVELIVGALGPALPLAPADRPLAAHELDW